MKSFISVLGVSSLLILFGAEPVTQTTPVPPAVKAETVVQDTAPSANIIQSTSAAVTPKTVPVAAPVTIPATIPVTVPVVPAVKAETVVQDTAPSTNIIQSTSAAAAPKTSKTEKNSK